MQDNNQQNNVVNQPNNINSNPQPVNNNSGVVNQIPVTPVANAASNINSNVNTISNNGNYVNGGQGYIEPPKKKNSFLTYIIIFLILSVSAVGGYFAGNYIYHATHPDTTDNQ